MYGRRRLRVYGLLILALGMVSFGARELPAQSQSAFGRLLGVVRDPAGAPQMGASVQVISEGSPFQPAAPLQQHLTNTQGIFRGEALAPGLYTIRVTLAGFLPVLEQHVRVAANITTMVRIELESMLASFDRLRRQPAVPADADDWKWVLRSSAAMRPVLQWVDSGAPSPAAVVPESPNYPHARLELTSGASRLGSVSSEADAAGTAFAYDQKLGSASRLLLAAQMSYERAPAGGVAAIWLPGGSLEIGPQTSLLVRESKLGWDGPSFRGMRMTQTGSVALGDRAFLRYGAEFVSAGLDQMTSSLRPRVQADLRLNKDWRAAVVFAPQPSAPPSEDIVGADDKNVPLVAVLNELSAFPTLLWHGGRPVLENGWHEELAVERKVAGSARLQVAVFHDDNQHVALYGRSASPLSGADFFRDFFSDALAYDGGSSSSWGTRAGLHEPLGSHLDLTAVYTFAGVLAPGAQSPVTTLDIRSTLHTQQRHAVAANVRARFQRSGTQVNAGYEWISGELLSRLDPYGESLFQTDPYLHFSIRQKLPRFGLGQWEALAECENLLAQGYVSMTGRDGTVDFVPAFRTIRGGLSVQF